MKHLIKDLELVAYLDGHLTKAEGKRLKEKLNENGELGLLYHLQLAHDKGLEEYANELIGKDDFFITASSAINEKPLDTSTGYRIAANKIEQTE